MKWTPEQQQELFFRWFVKMGVHRFDIQMQEPDPSAESTTKSWRWLKPSLNISTGTFFLKFSKWVKFINAKGGDIYIRPHGEASHALIFLDDLSIEKALQISRKYASCVVCTSKDNTQVWLATDEKLSKIERKNTQSWMKGIGYTDPGSTSGDHLGRLCGVRSQKRDCWVNLLVTTSGTKYTPPLIGDQPPISPPLRGEACASESLAAEASTAKSTKNQKPQSQSERDFVWAMGAMRRGMLFSDVMDHLVASAKRRGKRNADLYAQRTVSAVHQLIHGHS